MAKAREVLEMLCEGIEWTSYGESYEDIVWHTENKITKEQFQAGFAQFDSWKAEQEATKAAEKAALLDRLGITADEAKLLLS